MDKLRDHVRHAHKGDLIVTSDGSFEFEPSEDSKVVAKPTVHPCAEPGCEREFDQRAELLRHRRTHLKESDRPHKCATCNQGFLYPKDLHRHEKTHVKSGADNQMVFYCEIAGCKFGPGGQGFSRKDNLVRHMRRMHAAE